MTASESSNSGSPGFANAVAHQFQKTRVDDLLGRKNILLARRLILQQHQSLVGVFVGRGVDQVDRQNADVVPWDAGNQRALRGDGPTLDVAFQKIGIVVQVLRHGMVAALAGHHRGAVQCGDVRRQC